MLSKLTRTAGVGALALMLITGSTSATTYQVDPSFSSFELQNDIRPVKGTFSQIEGKVVYEPAAVEASSVEFRVATNSFKVENDNVVMGASLFFDLNKHPEIQFKSTRVENRGSELMVTGVLTMMGVSKEVTVPVKILGRGEHPKTGLPIAGFAAQMKLKLSDLGVDAWTNAAGILGDTLNIRLKMVGVDKEIQAKL